MNSVRVKVFLDTYHAPHNVKYRYWPGFLLLIRCVLFVIFAGNVSGDPSINLLCITSVSLGLAMFTRAICIYTNWLLDFLEGSFLLNLGILSGATFYVMHVGGNQKVVTYISIGIAFGEFIGIILYQAFLQLKGTAVMKHIQVHKVNLSLKLNVFQHAINSKREVKKDDVKNDREMRDLKENKIKDDVEDDTDMKDFGKYAHYRESVLYIADN